MIDTEERSLVVGFRPVPEATDMLLSAIGSVAAAAQFGDDDALHVVLEGVTPAVQALIYAGLLQRVEIVADDVRVAIRMHYYPDATEDDALGFANLALLQIGASRLDLRFVVSSACHAQALTADVFTAASISTIGVEMVEHENAVSEEPGPAAVNDSGAEHPPHEEEEGDRDGDEG